MDVIDMSEVQDLPDQVAIMVADIKGFSRHTDPQQNRLAPLLPQVLARASQRARIPELIPMTRTHDYFAVSRGDGYIVGFPPKLLPRVVDRYLECLQIELRLTNQVLTDGSRMRMRLSLHVGPAAPVLSPAYMDSPVGKAMNDTHRLVDAPALRVLLERSDPQVTFLAAALSEQVMSLTVRPGFTNRCESEFVATPVEIKAKEFTGTAYLRVPAPSGDLLRFGLLGVQPAKPKAGLANSPATSPLSSRLGGVAGSPVVGHDVTGSVGVVGQVSGKNHTIAGGDINQNTSTTHVGRDNYSAHGDMNFGTHSGRRIHAPEADR